jgi:hypothetical protein
MTYRSAAVGITSVAKPLDQIQLTGLGGLNDSVQDEAIDDSELSACRNYVLDYENAGALIKREGVTKKNAGVVSGPITFIFDGIHEDYYCTQESIYDLDGTELVSGLTTMAYPDFTKYTDEDGNQFDIFCETSNSVRKTSDGSSFGAIASAPSLIGIESFNNTLFGYSGNNLYWSDTGNEEVWNPLNTFTFKEVLTAIAVHHNYLYVFTDNEFFQIDCSNQDDVTIVYRGFEEGCSSNRSVVSTPYGLFWWSKNGPIRWTTVQGVPTIINIAKDKIPITINDMNHSKYNAVHAIWNPLKERVEFFSYNGTSTTVDIKVYYYPQEGAFFLGDGAGIEMGASGVVLIDGKPKVYVGSAVASGYFYEQTGDTDDGTPISGYVEFKRIAPLGQNARKRMRVQTPMFYVVGDMVIDYSLYYDDSNSIGKTWTLTGTSTAGLVLGTSTLPAVLGGSTEPKEFPISYPFRWRKIKPRMADSSAFRSRLRAVAIDTNILST